MSKLARTLEQIEAENASLQADLCDYENELCEAYDEIARLRKQITALLVRLAERDFDEE